MNRGRHVTRVMWGGESNVGEWESDEWNSFCRGCGFESLGGRVLGVDARACRVAPFGSFEPFVWRLFALVLHIAEPSCG